jgi:hypothetical protein
VGIVKGIDIVNRQRIAGNKRVGRKNGKIVGELMAEWVK